jgi:Fe-S-cluster-containing hydrogenase component 2
MQSRMRNRSISKSLRNTIMTNNKKCEHCGYAPCDKCGAYASPNNQNIVFLNSNHKMYCKECYEDIESILDCWQIGAKISITQKNG